MIEAKKRGGTGRGQGRKPLKFGEKSVTVSVRTTESQKNKLDALGGGKWIRAKLDAETVDVPQDAQETAEQQTNDNATSPVSN